MNQRINESMNQSGFPPPSAAWSFDTHAIAGCHFPISFRSQRFFLSAAANDVGPAGLAIGSATEAVRRVFAAIGKQSHARVRQGFDLSNRAVPASLFSPAAGACANAVFTYAQRIGILQRFR